MICFFKMVAKFKMAAKFKMESIVKNVIFFWLSCTYFSTDMNKYNHFELIILNSLILLRHVSFFLRFIPGLLGLFRVVFFDVGTRCIPIGCEGLILKSDMSCTESVCFCQPCVAHSYS
jgi:hypothetical protein